MKNCKIIFISSTGTELGKTYVTKNLIDICSRKKNKVMALKPIISGIDQEKLKESDSGILLNALNIDVNLKNIKSITPWFFRDPIAPTIAAKKENKKLSYNKIKNWITKYLNKNKFNYEYIFIEGAGGLLVPIGNKKTFLNLISDLNIPLILVVGSYLGSISHTLSCIKNIQQEKLNLINIIVNNGVKSNINIDQTIDLLKENLPNKIKIRKINKNKNNFQNILDDINRAKY